MATSMALYGRGTRVGKERVCSNLKGGWGGTGLRSVSDDWLKRWVAIVEGSTAFPFPDSVPFVRVDKTRLTDFQCWM